MTWSIYLFTLPSAERVLGEKAMGDLKALEYELTSRIPATIWLNVCSEALDISQILGEVVGDGSPSEFVRWESDECVIVALERVLNLSVRKPQLAIQGSCGFFESIVEGVFGLVCDSSNVNTVRAKVLKHLVNRFAEKKYRTCVWDLPEFRNFAEGGRRAIFNMRKLVQSWSIILGSTSRPISRALIELICSAFDIQIGIMTLTSKGIPFLFLFGLYGLRRVYLATNGGDFNSPEMLFFHIAKREIHSFTVFLMFGADDTPRRTSPALHVAGDTAAAVDSQRSTVDRQRNRIRKPPKRKDRSVGQKRPRRNLNESLLAQYVKETHAELAECARRRKLKFQKMDRDHAVDMGQIKGLLNSSAAMLEGSDDDAMVCFKLTVNVYHFFRAASRCGGPQW